MASILIAPRLSSAFAWLQDTINSPSPSDFGYCDLAFSGFLRIVTHPKVFKNPDTIETALSFVEQIRRRPNAVRIQPEERHWSIFRNLCSETQLKGNLVPDAWFAALAIEHAANGLQWTGITPAFRD